MDSGLRRGPKMSKKGNWDQRDAGECAQGETMGLGIGKRLV